MDQIELMEEPSNIVQTFESIADTNLNDKKRESDINSHQKIFYDVRNSSDKISSADSFVTGKSNVTGSLINQIQSKVPDNVDNKFISPLETARPNVPQFTNIIGNKKEGLFFLMLTNFANIQGYYIKIYRNHQWCRCFETATEHF